MRVAVLATAPAWLAAIAVGLLVRAIRLRRPLFFLHERVGLHRRPVLVPKIASTSVATNRRCLAGLVEIARGAPADLEIEELPEQWLRRTGLDELPQLFLVLAGTMRLVGPRPVTADELREMGESEVGVDFLAPGLTGLWQVLDRHAYTLPERRDLDMLMINNWSPQLQRRLLLLTVRQALERVTAGR